MPALINQGKQGDSNSFSSVSPQNHSTTSWDYPSHCRHSSNIYPNAALSDEYFRRKGDTNPTRSFAVPALLQNRKDDPMASSPEKLSRSFSDINRTSFSTHNFRKRNAPGATREYSRSPTIKHSRSQDSAKKQACDEQDQKHFYRAQNTTMHRPFKKHHRDFPSKCHSNIDGLNESEQYQQEQEHYIEQDSSHVSDRNIPPPLWTEGFAKEVTNTVKGTVQDIISRGILQHARQRKIWSLTPQDIFRSSSCSNIHEEDEEDVLGSGSFSKVSKIYIKSNNNSSNSDSSFALKRLKGDLLPLKLTDQSCKNGSVTAFTKAATELAREAFLLSRLDHPHIINIIGWTHNDVTSYSTYRRHDAYFLVLELLREDTLDDRIEGWNQNDMNLQQMSCTQDELKSHFQRRKIEQLTICKQVASALAYIHSRNVVYRDLKPQNIGFARSVQDSEDNIVVKLMDFGLARELPSNGILPPCSKISSQQRNVRSHRSNNNSASLFDMTGTVGTIRYMAPEVCLNRQYGLKCDVYSWSIVSHEILSQRKPYDDMTPDVYQSVVCQQGVRPPTQNMPSEQAALLTQAWRSDPSMRLPLHRILRQLDLLLKREKLVWEAQELLSGMPEKSASLSQSYSYENTSTRHRSQEEERQIKKRRWHRTRNGDNTPNGIAEKNRIFSSVSMDCHNENSATSEYNQNRNYDYPRNTAKHEQSPQPQNYYTTATMSHSSQFPQPVTPDQYHGQQVQQQEMPVQYEFKSKWNEHHYNSYNGTGARDGHLSPSHGYYRQWNGGYH
mmetsp:Transcript_17453/g.40265  ORF Transcript_17453/g.40265 Transcript_17453/m.40265 type:complete len:782 (-) Transcript_17453:156-2501(-)